MKAGLRIGERGDLKRLTLVYTSEYLSYKGFYSDGLGGGYVETKTGHISLIGKDDYYFTYCGNGIWDVRK